MLVDILVLCSKIFLPIRIVGIGEIDVTLPIRRQIETIFFAVALVLVQIPLILHAFLCGIVQCTVAKVVEHRLHAITMLCGDISTHHIGINLTIGDIGIDGIRRVRLMMGIMPVIKLHTIDVIAVEQCHLCVYCLLSFRLVVGSHKTIAGKTVPITRNVHGDSAVDRLDRAILCVYVHKITCEVLRRCCPRPCGTRQGLLFNDVSTVTVAHGGTCGKVAFHREADGLPRSIQSLVSGELKRKAGGDFYSRLKR